MTNTPDHASWPRCTVTVHPDGTAEFNVGGVPTTLAAATSEELYQQAGWHLANMATQLQRPLTATIQAPHGEGTMTASPGDHDAEVTWTRHTQPAAAPPEPGTPNGHIVPAGSESATSLVPTGPAPQEAPRRSFLKPQIIQQPASRGWRGAVNRLGLRLDPDEAERAERADVHAVSQHWPGPRTIVVANGKGGAGKTPSTILLAAVFARYGGAGVLAWDANQTRGTLGWRTEQGPHDATVLDLLPQVPRLLGTEAQSGDLAHYTHHQTADRYDVLRSQPLKLASEQRLQMGDIDAIWAVAARFYRVIIIDTGNDESDETWLRAAWHADVLVVPTTTRPDHAEAGALLLDALRTRDERSARLAQQAVAIVTQADPRANKSDVDTIVDGYRTLTRQVVHIPYDPALVDGPLHWDSLHPATQRAWLRAAAAVADGL